MVRACTFRPGGVARKVLVPPPFSPAALHSPEASIPFREPFPDAAGVPLSPRPPPVPPSPSGVSPSGSRVGVGCGDSFSRLCRVDPHPLPLAPGPPCPLPVRGLPLRVGGRRCLGSGMEVFLPVAPGCPPRPLPPASSPTGVSPFPPRVGGRWGSGVGGERGGWRGGRSWGPLRP